MYYFLSFKPLLLVLSFSVLTACSTTGSKDTFYGLERGAPPHAILLDMSGSMGNGAGDTVESSIAGKAVNAVDQSVGRVSTGSALVDDVANKLRSSLFSSARKQTTKLAEAQRQLLPFIRGLPDSALFNVMAFNNEITQAQNQMTIASAQNKSTAITFVKNLQAYGGTLMLPALERVITQKPSTIYLVTDGHPNDSQAAIISLVRKAAAEGIVINTVGIGKDQNRPFLSEIAQITGGQFNPQGLSIPILSP